MTRILVTGGGGLIGRALSDDLAKSGYEVILLSRNPAKVHGLTPGIRAVHWDGRTIGEWRSLIDANTSIVNLAGESIGIPPIPWTAERKRRIWASRIDAGRAVTAAVKTAGPKPRVLVQASAAGYYGLHGDEVVTEETPPGEDFLSRVAVDWEASTAEVEALGVRRAIIRTGVVLSRSGGVLQFLALPFRLFVGGRIGNGGQWVPWIHIADEVGAIRFLVENENAHGAFNSSAPNPLTNADFGRVLARVMKRPSAVPVPALAMKLLLGEMAELLLLGGQRAVPQRLQQAGYPFRFADAESALRDLFDETTLR